MKYTYAILLCLFAACQRPPNPELEQLFKTHEQQIQAASEVRGIRILERLMYKNKNKGNQYERLLGFAWQAELDTRACLFRLDTAIQKQDNQLFTNAILDYKKDISELWYAVFSAKLPGVHPQNSAQIATYIQFLYSFLPDETQTLEKQQAIGHEVLRANVSRLNLTMQEMIKGLVGEVDLMFWSEFDFYALPTPAIALGEPFKLPVSVCLLFNISHYTFLDARLQPNICNPAKEAIFPNRLLAINCGLDSYLQNISLISIVQNLYTKKIDTLAQTFQYVPQ
jgi:hypothetical protein